MERGRSLECQRRQAASGNPAELDRSDIKSFNKSKSTRRLETCFGGIPVVDGGEKRSNSEFFDDWKHDAANVTAYVDAGEIIGIAIAVNDRIEFGDNGYVEDYDIGEHDYFLTDRNVRG